MRASHGTAGWACKAASQEADLPRLRSARRSLHPRSSEQSERPVFPVCKKGLKFSEDVSKVATACVTDAWARMHSALLVTYHDNMYMHQTLHTTAVHSQVAWYSLIMRFVHPHGPNSSASMHRCHTVTVRDACVQTILRVASALTIRSRTFARAIACHQLLPSSSVRNSGHDRACCQLPAASSLIASPSVEAK